ncbi:hypothetical protein [Muricoccus radiodurans]|uniref:hypothetical protein n=1 Tax=Muricoccus radiodurans TaxID=2231721 RepID=UPI003CF73C62
MQDLTYHVRQAGNGWAITHAGSQYEGYKSKAAATKAAIDVASKLSLNGHVTKVYVEDPVGTSLQAWASFNEAPTIESLMEEFGGKSKSPLHNG